MSIANIITLGFGETGSIPDVILLGFAPASADPPATYVVEVDKDNDDIFDEDVTAVTRAQAGVQIIIGGDARQKLIPPRISSCSYEIGFPVISGVGRGDPTRVRGTFLGIPYGMFKGNIDATGIDPNITRQVTTIKALGPLAQAANRKGLSTQLHTNIRIDEAIGFILDELGLSVGQRNLDIATRGELSLWWLDSEMNVWAELQKLVRTEGPNARLYEDGDGVVQFEADNFRTTATRSTVLQETFRGDTTEPVYSKMAPVTDTSKRIVNNVKLVQQIRAADNDDIVYVGNSPADDQGNTSATVSKPEGLADGDIMFAHVVVRDDTGTNPTGLTSPTDTTWTLVGSGGLADSGDFLSFVYWKRKDAEDDAVTTYTWTWTNDSKAAIAIDVYRNCVENGTPYEASQIDSNIDDDATPSSTSITTLGANRRVISFIGTNSPSFVSAPTDFVVRSLASAQMTAPGSIVARSADTTVASAGAVGSLTWDVSAGGADSVLTTLALAPKGSVVWNSGGDIVLGNDEVRVLVARSSNVVENAQTPVENTDFTISAGALAAGPTLNRISGQTIEISITAGAAGCTIQGPPDDTELGMQLRADALPVTVRNEVTSTSGDADKALPGYSIWPLLSLDNMQALADAIVTYGASAKRIVSITIEADRSATTLTSCLERLPSDRIRILTTRTAIDVTGFVEEIRHRIGKKQRLTTTLTIREV